MRLKRKYFFCKVHAYPVQVEQSQIEIFVKEITRLEMHYEPSYVLYR